LVVKYHKAGAELLLSKIEKVSQGHQLDNEDIKDVMSEAAMDVWICAYEPWITSARTEIKKIMMALHADSPSELSKWGIYIDAGIRSVLENVEGVQAGLDLMSEFSWEEAEWAAHKYLPRDTPIRVDVFATIDGFNGGNVSWR
jgi:hypothetical protein